MTDGARGADYQRRDNRRLILAALIPLAAFGLQWVFWDSFKPFAWIFFYPAVFCCAWIGGLRSGLFSIAISTLVIWRFFIPNRYSFVTEQPAYAFTMLIFTSMGVLFSVTFERLRKANRQAAEALAAVSAANSQLEDRVRERTATLEQATNALRESEREFRTLAEAMPQIVWITRPDGWNIYFNGQWMDYTGMTLEESYGHGWNTPFHPDDKQRAWDAWQRATHNSEPYALECRLRRADGAYRWWLVRGVPLRDPAGKILKWFGTCTDIQDMKQAELALRESEERFRVVQELSPDGFTLLRPVRDPLGRVVDFTWVYENAAVARLNGTDPKAVLGRRLLELFPGHLGSKFLSAYQQVAESGGQRIFEESFSPGGASLPIWLRIAVVPTVGDIAILAQDITERKRAEISLQRSNRALRLIIECNQALVRATAETDLLQAICQITVHHGGYRMAWVGFAEQNQAKSVRPAAQAGFESGYLDTVDITWSDTERGRGPTGTAIRTGQPVIARDIPTDPAYGPWRAAAIQRGYASSATLPLISRGRPFGALMVYAGEPDAFNPEEIALLTELAGDLAYGITSLRAHAARERADAERQKFAMLADSSSEFIGMCDLDMKPIYVNPAGLLMVGLPDLAAACQVKVQDYFFPEDQRYIAQEFFPRVLREGHGDVEIRLRHFQTGAPVWMLYYLFTVRDASAEIVGWATVSRDITQRKQAEEERARLAMAVDQAAETVVITDANGAILYTNPAFEKTSGYTRAEALGQNLRILKSGPHDAEFYRQIWTVLARGEVWTGRISNKKKDGTIYEEDASISPVRDAAGRIINYVAVKRDVTREALLEAQLRQSQKMEAVGQLAGGLAHDFNNVLAIIRGNAELLLSNEAQPTAKTKEGLNLVMQATERAANLTRQLLAFSRKQVLQPQPLLLNDIVASLTKMLDRVISKNINLQCHYAALLPRIQADPGMIEQVILNLVINARDAMPHGGHLHLATEQLTLDEAHPRANPKARPGQFACLLVSDTGTGIPPEVLPRIFEPFFTTKEAGKGTGLGLASVYGIVQQHQGWIEVSSHVGQGTTFKVVLPAIPAPARLEAPAEAQVEVRGGSETILLVEDELVVRLTTRRILESKGYTIREAANAQEALDLWQSHAGEIALLLADIIMPGTTSGRDLADRLWGQRPGLRVIFVSGCSAEVADKETNIFPRTRSRSLQKPFTSRTLLETVRQCLDEEESPAPSPEAARPR